MAVAVPAMVELSASCKPKKYHPSVEIKKKKKKKIVASLKDEPELSTNKSKPRQSLQNVAEIPT